VRRIRRSQQNAGSGFSCDKTTSAKGGQMWDARPGVIFGD